MLADITMAHYLGYLLARNVMEACFGNNSTGQAW